MPILELEGQSNIIHWSLFLHLHCVTTHSSNLTIWRSHLGNISWKSHQTSLAQLKIGLKIFWLDGVWRMLVVPDWILEGLAQDEHKKNMLVIAKGHILKVWSRSDMIWLKKSLVVGLENVEGSWLESWRMGWGQIELNIKDDVVGF